MTTHEPYHALPAHRSPLAARGAYWLWLADDDRIRWNGELRRVVGVVEGHEPRTLGDFLALVHPEDRHVLEACLRRAGARGGDYRCEFRLYRPADGRLCRLALAGTAFLGAGTRPISHVGQLRPVETSQGHVLGEQRLREFMQHAPAGVFIRDQRSIHLYANERAAALVGRTVDELVGSSLFDVFPPDVAHELLASDRAVLGTRRPAVRDIAFRRPDQSQVLFRSTKFAIPGEEPLIGGFVEDITDAAAVAEQREQLLAAIEQSGEMILTTDRALHIAYASPELLRVTGYGGDELRGQPAQRLLADEPCGETVEELCATLQRAEGWLGRLRLRRWNGTVLPTLARFSPVASGDGVASYVVSLRDQTDEFEREQRLIQSQKMESVGRLAGGVAHDFNNMVQVILMNALTAADCLEPEQSDVRGLLEQIRDVCHRAAHLARQLLGFAAQQPVAPQELDLVEHVEGSIQLLSRLIGEHISMSWSAATTPCFTLIDPGQVDQILSNLVVNARDAIDGPGEIHISVSIGTLPPHRERAWNAPSGTPFVVLAVADNGCGMADGTAERVFDPFFTTKAPGEGTGLGLSTVYGIIKQNRGYIDFDTTLGGGTTFRVYLPQLATPAGAAHDEPGEAARQRKGGSETILVVEDEKLLESLLRRLLEQAGYRVLSAGSPRIALDVVSEIDEPIDLLLTDVVMPEMGGSQLSERLTKRFPSLRTLYMSGYPASAIEQRGLLPQGISLLQKPFTNEELLARIEEILAEG